MEALIGTFLPFLLIMGVMWFLMIRPQQKQAKARQAMIDGMQPGNHVVTIGGLHGVLEEVNRATQTVVIDCEGVYLTFNLSAISSVKESASTSEIKPVADVEEMPVDSDVVAES
ncbi:preprotein translocase subunit YajC [Aerococcaceae bacterium zg-ZUI334]|uniref:preprotein translocase subunit YajC n=1 Tax=Aerococcaceae bacterium zg-252 TaxID=2796928 RepID=UPI001B8F64E8|nr:preprotein translocase subunit YajC [Aerococcaceae bacterium zg-ZUI334]